jgi:EAL domain-containing protein (putative c-di-GMP-specific phosphodiesterase class I)
VQAVVNIADAHDMMTLAEGVETSLQRELLRALGCTEMQGFLFSAAKAGSRHPAAVADRPRPGCRLSRLLAFDYIKTGL